MVSSRKFRKAVLQEVIITSNRLYTFSLRHVTILYNVDSIEL